MAREVFVIEEAGRVVKCDSREYEMQALADLYNASRGSAAPQAVVVRYVPAPPDEAPYLGHPTDDDSPG